MTTGAPPPVRNERSADPRPLPPDTGSSAEVIDARGPRRRATLGDIAARVGVSKPTVSRALRDDPQVGERTRTAVRLVAAELGYVPNNAARTLANATSRLLGLLIPDLVDPMHSLVAEGFERAARASGYAVMIATSHRDAETEARSALVLRAHQADGIAVCGAMSDLAAIEAISSPAPMIFIGPEATNSAGSSGRSASPSALLETDDREGIKLLVAHLLDVGLARLSYLNGPDIRSNRVRRLAVGESLEQRGLEPRLREYPHVQDWDGYLEVARRIRSEKPEAVVCYDDDSALHLLAALRERHVKVPDDVAVTGFDDIPYARLMNPTLTTVAQPAADLGSRAASMIIRGLEEGLRPESASLTPELVIRETTGGAPAERTETASG